MIRLIFLTLLTMMIGCQDINSNSFDEFRYKEVPIEEGDVNFVTASAIVRNRCASCHEHSTWASYSNSRWIESPYIVRGDPENSLLIQRIINTGGAAANMPLGSGALPESEYNALKTWISSIP